MPTIRLKNELMRPICTASLRGTVEKEVIALNANLKSFGILYLLLPFMRGLWVTSIVVTLKPVHAIMPCTNLAYSLISFIISPTLLLRTLSRRVGDMMKEMREYARFVHGMMAWTGFKVTTMEVTHSPRMKGKSKYNIPKLFRLAFNAITSFSTVPLRLAVHIGIISSFLSLIVGLYFVYRKILYGIPVLGYASIIVSVFFVGGIQLLVLGIFGEYLGRVYQEVQRRPLYVLKESMF